MKRMNPSPSVSFKEVNLVILTSLSMYNGVLSGLLKFKEYSLILMRLSEEILPNDKFSIALSRNPRHPSSM